jgi:LuxR family maltose regulon positive regulatory protein
MMMSFHYRDACDGGASESLTPSPGTAHRPSQSMNHILWDKLRIPSNDNTIERERLTGLLDRSTKSSSATLISGRAGTGKTETAAAFANQKGNSAWYSLGPPDAEWGIFAPHFAAAINEGELPHGEIALPDDSRMRETEIEKFLASVFSRTDELKLIVIDDIHHIFDADWFGVFFPLLIRSLPPATHLVLTCRSKPPAPLWRMRSKQVLNVVDEKVLAFDLDETKRLFKRLGVALDGAQEAHSMSFGRVGKLLMLAGK